jgi:hypothetical protein
MLDKQLLHHCPGNRGSWPHPSALLDGMAGRRNGIGAADEVNVGRGKRKIGRRVNDLRHDGVQPRGLAGARHGLIFVPRVCRRPVTASRRHTRIHPQDQ